jgi:hypothetical protein
MNEVDSLYKLPFDEWRPEIDDATQQWAIAALESGMVLFLPRLGFALQAAEQRFLSADWSDGRSKNISLGGARREIKGARGSAEDRAQLGAMIARFADCANQLVAALLPSYVANLKLARTSYRPCAVETRVSSYRKDDSRLHVDAFPSQPNRGERILRVFTNVHPNGEPRRWRVGEPFEAMAKRYLESVGRPLPGSAAVLHAMRITKTRRSEYDHIMLRLHDTLKGDLDYQAKAPRQEIEFPSGSTWVVYSDQVLHAALSGQFMFEQTFHLPVSGLRRQETSPLRVLERLTGRALSNERL